MSGLDPDMLNFVTYQRRRTQERLYDLMADQGVSNDAKLIAAAVLQAGAWIASVILAK